MIRRAAIFSLALGLIAPVVACADPPGAHILAQSSAVIAPGDTLDSVLGRAGMQPALRAEAALALSGICDLTDLRPGQVDFRRDRQGDETFAIVWQEDQPPDGSIGGEPRLNYARLELQDRVLELVVTEAAGPVIAFEDGAAVQRSAAPIRGGRMSSVFGRRNHPVLGGMKMHMGIDYAAPVGTEVSATGAGRAVFAGTIRGYGLAVDVDHGGGVVTRYAHLSAIADAARQGARVKAGDRIGAVGATGLVSGPNLHYEVRGDGRPVDPTDHDVLPEQEIATAGDLDALATWRRATGFVQPEQKDKG